MDKRFAIGIKFFFDNKSNSGVVNYIFNIVAALNTLPDEKKPQLIVFYSENSPIDFLKTLEYPYVEYILFKASSSNFVIKTANALIRKITGIDIFKQVKYFNKIDCLYPYFEFMDYEFKGVKNKIHWLVDFNNRAFPGHYKDGAQGANESQLRLAASTERVILSSQTLFNELKMYHPDYKCDVRVLCFASTLPRLNENDIDAVKQRLGIEVPYLMSPNQFWEHKNQVLVLDALHIIKTQHPELKFKILFSGSMEVNRGKGLYVEVLQKKVEEYQLQEYISFLGILERNDQLLMMKGAVALLQPSLYEGWSTLVEESKALGRFVILSDLPVHREQITTNVAFFDPYNADELADKIVQQLTNPSPITPIDYNSNIKVFGEEILSSFAFE